MKFLQNATPAVLIVATLIAVCVYVAGPRAAQARAAPPGSPVVVEEVRLATVVESIEAVGSLRSNEATVISPELSGRIEGIEFQEGEPVSEGEALISLDGALYRAEVAQARASLELSEANYERAEELLVRQAGSVTARDEALAQRRVDEAGLALAEARLAKMTITAPFDGVIGLRAVSVGDYVVPGQKIVNLVDGDPIKVDFRLPEIYLSESREGQKIEVAIDALPDETFTGRVYAIDPVIDINGRAIQLRARIPNADGRLQPGLFARVSVNVARREGAILIDESALVAREDGKFVYRIEDGRAQLTHVEVGIRRPGEVEIIKGLAPGAVVVTAGHQRLDDNAPVDIVERG